MSTYPISKYKFVCTDSGKIIALTTFAGQTVRGVAICAPNDTYDEEFGKRLAAARANLRVARKRQQRAEAKHAEAVEQLCKAHKHKIKMIRYLEDARESVLDAEDELLALTDDED